MLQIVRLCLLLAVFSLLGPPLGVLVNVLVPGLGCWSPRTRVLTGGEFPAPIVISDNLPRRQGLCQRRAGAAGQEFCLEANLRPLL